MNFSEVADVAFSTGPKWCRGWGPAIKFCINFGLFLTYFGTCAVYTVIISENFMQVANYYFNLETVGIRYYITALLIPLILLSWLPNLKYLAPVSMISNIFMGLGLGITMWYLVTDLPEMNDRQMFASSVGELPIFFAIVIFAMEAIGMFHLLNFFD